MSEEGNQLDKFEIGGEGLSASTQESPPAGSGDQQEGDAISRRRAALEDIRVRVGTLLKTETVSFLLGAGASVDCSQRPSELSKTVLAQCSSFIVHRLQNPEDLRYFKEIVPGIYGPMLEQIPALAPQTGLVLGECVPAPALVKIREARPVPRSRDPKFFRYWVAENDPRIDVESICADWEGESDGPADSGDRTEEGDSW